MGGGGKTSLLYALAKENPFGRVLCTTTTHMMDPRLGAHPFTRVIIPCRDRLPLPRKEGDICFAAKGREPGRREKVKGGLPLLFDAAGGGITWPLVVVEADGAARRPLKAPASHEPALPRETSILVGCIGLDVLGKPLNARWVHRPEKFSEITGLPLNADPIEGRHLAALICHKEGLFKSCPAQARRFVFLNKMDLLAFKGEGLPFMAKLQSLIHSCGEWNVKICCASLVKDEILVLD